MAIHINELDITGSFENIKSKLFNMLVLMFQFSLYLKNDTITSTFSHYNIIKEYKKYNNAEECDGVLMLFDKNCKLADAQKITKVVLFIKNLKNELIKHYE
jgi:hypothetical protein